MNWILLPFRKFIIKYPHQSQRLLEILPGFVSWSMILFPVWGSFLWPVGVAYYIIAFDVYWFYRSMSMSIFSVMAFYRIKASEKYDWMGDVEGFADWNKVRHVVVIPTYKEPLHTLERNLDALMNQTFPADKIVPVLAFEERAGKDVNDPRVKALLKKYKGVFGELVISIHPDGIAGEVVGKSSNAAWGAKEFAKVWKSKHKKDWDIRYMTISSADADVQLHPNHMAAVTYKFLDSPHRYRRIWQGAILYYNNIEQIPWLMRVFNRVSSIVQMGILMRPERLVNFSTYTLSLKLMDEVGYWDTDVIPEDYRMFFKAYFATAGEVEIEPIFLPVYADAAESTSFIKTFNNTYQQVKRWAWGASDDAYFLKNYFLDQKAPFWDKTLRVLKVLEDHFLWPVNWFAITLGATLPPLLNEDFSRTILGKTLPQVASAILTASLVGLLLVIFVDMKARPGLKDLPLWKRILSPFEMILLPVVGLVFTALPGLEAHTRLMMGRYLEYRVTEKV